MHIVKTRLSLLFKASVPLSYWEYAFKFVVHLVNITPPKTIQSKSPFELLYDKKTT